MNIFSSLWAQLAARAFNFYNGLAPAQLKIKSGEPDDNVHVNYSEVIVDKGVGFLFGESLVIGVGTDEDTTGEEYLETVWPQAQRDEEFQEMAEDGAKCGDAYLKISIEPSGRARVTVGDPLLFRVETDEHDVSRVVAFHCTYQLRDGAGRPYLFRETTSRADDGLTWLIEESHSYDNGKTWARVGDGVIWNFPFPPIFHCKNLPNPKSVYGRPDLTEPVLKIISYISRLDSMCGKIVRIHSSPKPYAKNLKKQDLEWGTDGMLFLKPTGGAGGTSVEAEIGLLEMKQDISTALSLRKVLREGLAEMTGVPEVASGKVENIGQLSGLALRILYGPLISKTKKKQLRYGRMIKECVQALLVIGNIKGKKVKLNWPDPLPGDQKEKVEVAEGKKRLGVSEATLQKELGYDPAHEREQRQFDTTDTATELLNAFDSGEGAAVSGKVERTADEIKKLVEAAGALIRAGFKPEGALAAVGLNAIEHLGLLPITLRDETAIQNAEV
ncbi:MAG TPA: phage portal protein [Pyrinomonadaceae bacterium]|nr:phage portal protein [Pyrinomonadaceae bacterium]